MAGAKAPGVTSALRASITTGSTAGFASASLRLPRPTRPLPRPLARLTDAAWCLTLYNMKTATLTIRLDEDLNDLLTDASRSSGRNRSEVAREALRRQLRLSQFESLRRRIMPLAEARGFLTDEDVFSQVS